ncbi:hypothetical protein [Desulfatibacillum aliphaticivorans]|uniref:hypothetical protein n=1 Tax=Desulfatibacillum aliphaticivorans TaxID=218208 RepID=UPI000409B433|nr:hypothetical protein [Desulfatibacillum aliphaticivorans]
MGDFGDFLFGATDDAKYLGNVDTLLPVQKSNLINLNQLLAGQLGQGVESYGGQISAGVSPLQQQGFDLVNQLIQGEGAYGQGQNALSALLGDFDETGVREAWEASVKDPMIQNWQDEILPEIQEHYIAANAGSSGAATRAITDSGQDLAVDLASSLSESMYSAEQSHLDRQASSLPLALDYAQAPIDLAMTAGQTQRDISGEQLLEEYQKWAYEQPYNNPWLSYLNLGLNTSAFEPIVQGTSYQPGALNSLTNLISLFT